MSLEQEVRMLAELATLRAQLSLSRAHNDVLRAALQGILDAGLPPILRPLRLVALRAMAETVREQGQQQ